MIEFAAPAAVVRAAAFGVALVFVFGALSIARRGARRRLRCLLYGFASLAAFGLLAKPRLLPADGDDFAILWTVGADPERGRQALRRLRKEHGDVEVRRAPGVFGAEEVEPLGRWQELADFSSSWRLLGPGLLPAEVLALPPGRRWMADPRAAPTGLVDLWWPRSVPLGREVVVAGRYRSPSNELPGARRWRLRGPGGVESETMLEVDGSFRLAALPRVVGPLTWVLESVGVEAPAGASSRVEASLDTTVEPPRFPPVRILAARPDPEAAALRRWLARRGARVEFEVGLSDGIEAEFSSAETETSRRPTGEPPPLTVVFGDPLRGPAALPRVGSMILVGEAALRAAQGGPPQPSERDMVSAVAPRSRSGGRLGALSLGARRLPSASVVQPLWLDERGGILAGVLSPAGTSGRVVATLVESSFRYALRGEPDSYALLWSDLLEAAATSDPAPRCSLPSGPILDGDPLSVVCWRVPGEVAPLELEMEMPNGVSHALDLVAHPLDGDRFETRLWPRGEGWYRLSARQGEQHAEVAFRARSRAEWASWDAERRFRATADLAARSAARPPATGGLRPLPVGWLFTWLLASLAVLWAVERSTG